VGYKRWKKIVWKKCENTFFLKTHEYCYKKLGEKIREKIFSRNTQISQANIDGKKSSGKSGKTRFFKHTNIVNKKWGKKTREIIFSRNTRISQAKNDGKNRLKKVRKNVF